MFAYASVFVIVSEKPAPEAALLPDLVQIVGQAVLLVETAADDVLDRAGGAVGKDHIHPIADCFEILQPLCIFFFGGKLLFPPGQVVDAVQRPGPIQSAASKVFLEKRLNSAWVSPVR